MATKKELQKNILNKSKNIKYWANQLSISLESVDEAFDDYTYDDLRYLNSIAYRLAKDLKKAEKDIVSKYA